MARTDVQREMKEMFGEVIGVSLCSPCTFRFRRRLGRGDGAAWQRYAFLAEPRSVYLLSGPARTDFEHSIPAVASLRYSITFRTLRAEGSAPPSPS